jgi:hypothetical protein
MVQLQISGKAATLITSLEGQSVPGGDDNNEKKEVGLCLRSRSRYCYQGVSLE